MPLEPGNVGGDYLNQARAARERAYNRLYEMVDARQRHAAQQRLAADEYVRGEEMADARNYTSSAMTGAQTGSKFGPYGALAGAVIGGVAGQTRAMKSIEKRAQEEGWSSGKKKRKMLDQLFNPVHLFKGLGRSAQKNPQQVVSLGADLALMAQKPSKLKTADEAKKVKDITRDTSLKATYSASRDPGYYGRFGSKLRDEDVYPVSSITTLK